MLRESGADVADYGAAAGEDTDYPDVALTVAEAVARGEHERAILICGTGIGMAIAANKVPGVYAAQVHDAYSAERARKSNNAQVMNLLGARVVGPELAESLVRIWLDPGSRAARRPARSPRSPLQKRAGARWVYPGDRLTLSPCVWRSSARALVGETADRGSGGPSFARPGPWALFLLVLIVVLAMVGCSSTEPRIRISRFLSSFGATWSLRRSGSSPAVLSCPCSCSSSKATSTLPRRSRKGREERAQKLQNDRQQWRLEAVERSVQMLNDVSALATRGRRTGSRRTTSGTGSRAPGTSSTRLETQPPAGRSDSRAVRGRRRRRHLPATLEHALPLRDICRGPPG